MTHQIDVLQRKIQLELTNASRVGNVNDAAYLISTKAKKEVVEQPKPSAPVSAPSIDKKFDWYQNAQFVFLSYKVSSPEVSQDA